MLIESHYGTAYQNCWVRFPGWDLLRGVNALINTSGSNPLVRPKAGSRGDQLK